MSVKNSKISNDINIFGGYGYVGSVFHEIYGGVRNSREDYFPKTKNILYLISTISNHTFLEDPHKDIQTNLVTLIKVLENVRLIENATFNFISSGFVYGENEEIVNEDTPCNPKGFYSATKRCAEQLVEFYCKAHKINYRILRLCNVIGGVDRKTSPKKNSIHFMIEQIMEGKTPTLFLEKKEDKTIREYMDVSDICHAIKLIMTKGSKNEIYNISSSEPISQQEILEYAHRLKFDTDFKYEVTPQNEFEKMIYIPSIRMSNQKLKKLGFSQNKNIHDIINNLVRSKK